METQGRRLRFRLAAGGGGLFSGQRGDSGPAPARGPEPPGRAGAILLAACVAPAEARRPLFWESRMHCDWVGAPGRLKD